MTLNRFHSPVAFILFVFASPFAYSGTPVVANNLLQGIDDLDVNGVTYDVEFVNVLKAERILVVPGTGFNGPGYFRIAFCVDDSTIQNSLPGFEKAIAKFR